MLGKTTGQRRAQLVFFKRRRRPAELDSGGPGPTAGERWGACDAPFGHPVGECPCQPGTPSLKIPVRTGRVSKLFRTFGQRTAHEREERLPMNGKTG